MVDTKKMQLVVGNKVWGEFDSHRKRKNRLYVDGYRSYGGVHTIRLADNVNELNDREWEFILELVKLSRRSNESDEVGSFLSDILVDKLKRIVAENEASK